MYQVVSGFNDGYATFSQFLGTCPFYIDKYIESSSYDITMNPLIAFFNNINEDLIITKSLLNLYISCKSTVLNDGIRPYLSDLNISFFPADFSINCGKPFFNSFALSITISSGVLTPAAPPILG
jgi:hypothetical protein